MFKSEVRMLELFKRKLLIENKDDLLSSFLFESDNNKQISIVIELFDLGIIDNSTFLSTVIQFYEEKIKNKELSKNDARIFLLGIFKSERINSLKINLQNSETSSFKLLMLKLIEKAEIKNSYIKEKINLFLLEISWFFYWKIFKETFIFRCKIK